MTRTTTAKKSRRQVWRMVHKTEPPEDVRIGRQGPLLYSQNPVTPATEDSALLLGKLDLLARRKNGLELEGAWVRLDRRAHRHTWAFRPYILNLMNQPATTQDIAREILFVTPAKAEQILKELEALGLIEQVTEPNWEQRGKEGKQRTRTAKKKATQSKQTGHKKTRVRTCPDKSGQVRTPYIRESEIEDNRKGRKEKKNRREVNAREGGRQRKDHPSPATTPPMTPANPDAGAGPRSRGREARPTSISRLGNIVQLPRDRYSASAWAFADGVLLASGYRCGDAAERACERSHWAAAWDDAAAEFGPDVLARLKTRIIEAAAGIHGRRGDYRNPESYLLRAWQNDVKDARRQRCARGAG